MNDLTLCMIVKNEESTVERCLRSAARYVTTVVVIDTGSTDDTMLLIESVCSELELNLHIDQRPWKNFGHNRNELLAFADEEVGDGYYLLLDADMTVHCPDIELVRASNCDAHEVPYTGDTAYTQMLLVRGGYGFRYEGVTHEYIWSPRCQTVGDGCGLSVTHHFDGGSRGDKYDRDLRLLMTDWQRAKGPRTAFYIARTAEVLGRTDQAIEWFRKRAEMGAFEEEAWYARYSAGKLSGDAGELLAAWEQRPWRVEPLYQLVFQKRQALQYETGLMVARRALQVPFPEGEKLWVERNVYDYLLMFEASICANYVSGAGRDGVAWCDELLQNPAVDANTRAAVLRNRQCFFV